MRRNFVKTRHMKRVLVCAVLTLFALSNTGCLKKAKQVVTGGTMRAMVNGVPFKSYNVSAFSGSGHFYIDGTTMDGKQLSISIPDASTHVPIYTIDRDFHQAWWYVNNSAKPATAVSGQVSVHYRGTNQAYGGFSFVCDDGTQVTDGFYDAVWQ